MKKWWKLLALALLGTWLAITVNLPRPVHASADMIEVKLKGGGETSRGQPHVTVYDLPASVQALSADDWHDLQEKLTAMSPDAIAQYVLPLSTVATGSSFTANVGHRYLVESSFRASPFAQSWWIAPVALQAPKADTTVELKSTTTNEVPYFYKYGVDNNGVTKPLAGAVFTLTRKVDGLTQTLTSVGWEQNGGTPLTFTSQADGQVRYSGPTLETGDYAFKEIHAPSGYQVNDASQHVVMHVPKSGNITIAGVQLAPVMGGHVLDMMLDQAKLWVVNYPGDGLLPGTNVTPPTSDDPPTSGTPKAHQPDDPRIWLPQTGEAKAKLLLIGVLLIGLAIGIWSRLKVEAKKN